MKILIGIICIVLFILIADGIMIGVPFPCLAAKGAAEKYQLKQPNRIDLQKSTECSGFSGAYVLRSFGIEAEGNEMYAKMPGRLKNGAVLPKNLKKVLKHYGLKVKYCIGSLNSMKAELCKGNRVIVFVKTRPDKNWLHYVPIVGYDKEEIFIAESLKVLVNCREPEYNRRLSTEAFLKLWDTRAVYMPFYKNTYLVIEKPELHQNV